MTIIIYRTQRTTASAAARPLGSIEWDTDTYLVIRRTPDGQEIDRFHAWRGEFDFDNWLNSYKAYWSKDQGRAYWNKGYWIDEGL